MDEWRKQIENLTIPYPKKSDLICEIKEHLLHRREERSSAFEEEDLRELYEVHNTRLMKALAKILPKARISIELILSATPILALTVYLFMEEFMLDFIRQGGAGMLTILVIGSLLLLRELVFLFRVVIIKDHSPKHIAFDSVAVTMGAVALNILGIGVTTKKTLNRTPIAF